MRRLIVLIGLWSACVAASPAALPRSVSLGISATAKEGTRLLTVDQVAPSSSAAKLGIVPGDTIVAVNGSVVRTGGELVAAARSLRAGDRLAVTILRGGRRSTLSGTAIGRPLESYRAASTHYGAVASGGGLLRDILVRPARPAPGHPAVFLIQGFSCASVENADPMHPYRQLVAGLVAHGIAVYRIEKPGMGDSRGPDQCSEIGLETELAGFEAGYAALQKTHGYAARQVFLFGHSLGGMEAPFIAARDSPPGGIAVYGIAAKRWYDYVLDVIRVQDVLSSGADPVERDAAVEAAREPLRQLYLGAKSPAAVVKAYPGAADMLRQTHDWDGADHLFGRHYRFLQDLARMRQTDAWKNAKSPLLSLYGESDLIAISGEDARFVAAIVNHYRPGSAEYAEMAGLEHGMTLVGSRADYARAMQSGRFKPMTGTVGPGLIDRLVQWVGRLSKGHDSRKTRESPSATSS